MVYVFVVFLVIGESGGCCVGMNLNINISISINHQSLKALAKELQNGTSTSNQSSTHDKIETDIISIKKLFHAVFWSRPVLATPTTVSTKGMPILYQPTQSTTATCK